jgi:hypothetical protein
VAKNLSTFCPCPGSLREAKFKYNELINLAEEISRQHSIWAVTRLLLADLLRFTVRTRSKKQSGNI